MNAIGRHWGGGRRGGHNATVALSSVPVVVGMIDSASFLIYLLNLDQSYFYAAALAAKVAILALCRADLRSLGPAALFIGLNFTGSLLSSALNPVPLADLLQLNAALLYLVITIVCVNGDMKGYGIGLSLAGFVICAIYLSFYLLGFLFERSGRFHFFGATHPNLGGEILGAIVVLATLSLPRAPFYLLSALSAYCCWLMQSRAALVAIGLATGLHAAQTIAGRYDPKSNTLLAIGGLALAAALGGMAWWLFRDAVMETLGFLNSSVFLVDDQHRGIGTGLSGRDLHWSQTAAIISANPFFGAGLNYAERMDIAPPHNWFLYPVAEMGLLGAAVVGITLHRVAMLLTTERGSYVQLLPILLLMFLNARYLNLNANPLVFLVFLFHDRRSGQRERLAQRLALRAAARRLGE